GSVKSNLGHLEAASGVVGLIKTVLSLENRFIPPTLHCQHPNPKLALESTPFRLAHQGRAWAERPGPPRAGVSPFGIRGAHAPALLQEAPPQEPSGDAHPPYLLCLSAKTPEALERRTDDLAAHLESNAPASLADVAYTLAVGRKAHSYRRV